MMFKQVNIPILVAVALVSLLMFFGLAHCYRENQITKVVSFLSSKEEVDDWTTGKMGKTMEIVVKPSYSANISRLWPELEKGLDSILGGKYTLSIANDSSLELLAVYEEMKFSFYEGLEKGNLISMKKEMENLAQAKEIEDLVLAIDKNNVYLELKSAGRALYEVMPRKHADSFSSERSDSLW